MTAVTRLEGDRVAVEPLAERHEDDLRAAALDPEVWRWLPGDHPATPEAFGAYLAEALAASAAGQEVAFAVVDRASGRAVGMTRFLELQPEHRTLEIGWTWYAREVWRTGVNVETKLLLLRHAFETLGSRRVEFKTDARNARSRAAILALGASFEGVFRNHRLVPRPRDSAWYSIVDDEWPEVRARLQERLARAGRGEAPAATPSSLRLDQAAFFEPDETGMRWLPVRDRLGISAFGVGAFTAAPGDTVVEDHTEEGTGHEELYVVVSGRARFTIGEEGLDAPAGTLVRVPSGVRRVAVAESPGTYVLGIGAAPGEAFRTSAWELRALRELPDP